MCNQASKKTTVTQQKANQTHHPMQRLSSGAKSKKHKKNAL